MSGRCREIKQKTPVFTEVSVIAIGFEPMTACLEGRCSIQLSYATRLFRARCSARQRFEFHDVGVAGFEPATSWSQTRRDNRATLHPAAESKGFEPLVPFPVRMFSKHVLSASQATLRAITFVKSGCKCSFQN